MPKGPKGEKRPADVISKNTTNANGQSPATRFRFTLNGDHASLIISGRPWFDGARNLLYAPRSALVIDHPNSRFLQLRRLILMATSSARSAATLNDPHAAEAARREAVSWSLRLSAPAPSRQHACFTPCSVTASTAGSSRCASVVARDSHFVWKHSSDQSYQTAPAKRPVS